MRIAFVTCDDDRVADEDTDRPHHDAAFAAAGAVLEHPPWDDPSVPWHGYDLVVLRSTWDYTERLDEFLAWLDATATRAPLANAPALVRWNLDKRYLAELAAEGVPVVPTAYATDEDELVAALARVAGADGPGDRPGGAGPAEAAEGAAMAEVVVKPTVSAGSRRTGRFAVDDPAALALGLEIVADGRTAMVQPFVGSVAEAGEVGLLLFDGVVSHAIRKGPILAPGGGFLGGAYQEAVSAVDAEPAEVAVAEQVMAALRTIGARHGWAADVLPPLYARIDLVHLADGRPALLEAELFEPSLFLEVDPPSAARFAEATLRRARDTARG